MESFRKTINKSVEDNWSTMVGDYLEIEKSSDDTILLHLQPKKDGNGQMTSSELFKDIKMSLPNIARQLTTNTRLNQVKKIGMLSWIITTNPGLVERLGFVLEDAPTDLLAEYKNNLSKNCYVPKDKRNINPTYAEMPVDEYLIRYNI